MSLCLLQKTWRHLLFWDWLLTFEALCDLWKLIYRSIRTVRCMMTFLLRIKACEKTLQLSSVLFILAYSIQCAMLYPDKNPSGSFHLASNHRARASSSVLYWHVHYTLRCRSHWGGISDKGNKSLFTCKRATQNRTYHERKLKTYLKLWKFE